MQSAIPKKKIKPNWDIRMMFGEISNRHKEDITKEKNIEELINLDLEKYSFLCTTHYVYI